MTSTATVFALAAVFATTAQAQFAPVKLDLSSYNQDMIVENPLPATTASMDNGPENTGASFYEMGYYLNDTSTGLPPAGSTITGVDLPDHSYTFAPDYTTNNAVLIDPTITNATITLTFPAAFSALSFMCASGNGAEIIAYTVHHQDNTIDTGTFEAPDWFGNSPIAFNANGRCDVQGRTFDTVEGNNPRLYSEDISLGNTTSPITSIDFARTIAGGHGAIFAISGSTGGEYDPITFTGYNKDMIVEATAQELPPEGLYTTASMDGGTGNTGASWYVKGFYLNETNTGLPAAGSVIASAAAFDHQYRFAPDYSSNDVVYVDSSTTGTMLWSTPSKHSALSFLASAGHGPVTVDYTVSHADSTTETGSFDVLDWFDGEPVAFSSNGRVDVDAGFFDSLDEGNPRLYTFDITLSNSVSPVVSVSLAYDPNTVNAGSVAAFFAVSGTGGAIQPVIVTQPASLNAYAASSVQLTTAVSGSDPLQYHWLKGTGGAYVTLTDGGRISGSTSSNLTISPATFSDDGFYELVVTNAAGAVTSAVAYLNIVSTTPTITVPGDAIDGYNGSSPAAESVGQAIDGTTSKYLNFGGNGGTPSYVGPTGFVVTPAMGSTVVTGIRMYTANDSPERDPVNYVLEGSNDGGGSFTPITTGAVNLPDDRNPGGEPLDPINEFNREVNFANGAAYTTYRFSVNDVKNDITANSMQIGEVELLGTTPSSAPVTLTLQNIGGGQLQLTWLQGTLQSSDSITGPYADVSGASSPYIVMIAPGTQFYRIRVQ